MVGKLKIGILALQGAFTKHAAILDKLGMLHQWVKTPQDLQGCSGLILPGGESTVMSQQLIANALVEPIRNFAKTSPLFGTCAGMILMSEGYLLHSIDMVCERNAYGKQRKSFTTPLAFHNPEPVEISGCFIRAPKILQLNSPDIQVLATLYSEPVCLQQGKHLACSFHPELTQDLQVHDYFLKLVTL